MLPFLIFFLVVGSVTALVLISAEASGKRSNGPRRRSDTSHSDSGFPFQDSSGFAQTDSSPPSNHHEPSHHAHTGWDGHSHHDSGSHSPSDSGGGFDGGFSDSSGGNGGGGSSGGGGD